MAEREEETLMPPQKHIDATKVMMGKRNVVDPMVGIGGSVPQWAKDRLYAAAGKEEISPSCYIGRVLIEHAKGLEEWKDPNQGELDLEG